ncbi:hypothetical protein Nepgr_006366 [Nepenthes gracilis]|uniref:Ig-like domain-containing protein n=1 Tax=Nepenthes gracilis TaxID=150966 RepID=A0AAD3S524_NEPGR|nr:hypothetical protein Nepgr_006366 [Nepenthes gracilis]
MVSRGTTKFHASLSCSIRTMTITINSLVPLLEVIIWTGSDSRYLSVSSLVPSSGYTCAASAAALMATISICSLDPPFV